MNTTIENKPKMFTYLKPKSEEEIDDYLKTLSKIIVKYDFKKLHEMWFEGFCDLYRDEETIIIYREMLSKFNHFNTVDKDVAHEWIIQTYLDELKLKAIAADTEEERNEAKLELETNHYYMQLSGIKETKWYARNKHIIESL